MRFNSTAEVWQHAKRAAASDFGRCVAYGYDLNPFCTVGARHDWVCGNSGTLEKLPIGASIQGLGWHTIYQRGRAAFEGVETLRMALNNWED